MLHSTNRGKNTLQAGTLVTSVAPGEAILPSSPLFIVFDCFSTLFSIPALAFRSQALLLSHALIKKWANLDALD